MGPVTQEDPIGIAGGLNLYGYANGDPINNSDPFGLCAPPVICPPMLLPGLVPLPGMVPANTESLDQAGQALEGFVRGNLETAVGVGSVLVGNAVTDLVDSATGVAFGVESLLKWGRKKVGEIGLVIGQILAGSEGSDKAREEQLRQQEAQEQLDREQKPKPGGGR
jgi:uncharacterized protein RhaS with RHS repeats